MKFNTEKLNTMFNRLVENKSEAGDRDKLSAYLKEVFGTGYPSQHDLHQFNTVVVEQADIIARRKASDIFALLADFSVRPEGEIVQYRVPTIHKAKWVWSANGTSVEHVRIGSEGTRLMTPTKISTGAYYEIGTLQQGDVDYFNTIVNDVADAKNQAYFAKLSQMLQAAIASGQVPTANVLQGTNLTLRQYTELAAVFARNGGGRPVFVADVDLIDHFAFQQTTDTTYKELLYPELQRSLVEDLAITQIGRTTAVNIVNPFIAGSGNTATELPRNEGFIFASGANKPMKLVEFGAMKQYTEFDSDLEQVQIKLTQLYALDFVDSELIGYVQDDSITA